MKDHQAIPKGSNVVELNHGLKPGDERFLECVKAVVGIVVTGDGQIVAPNWIGRVHSILLPPPMAKSDDVVVHNIASAGSGGISGWLAEAAKKVVGAGLNHPLIPRILSKPGYRFIGIPGTNRIEMFQTLLDRGNLAPAPVGSRCMCGRSAVAYFVDDPKQHPVCANDAGSFAETH